MTETTMETGTASATAGPTEAPAVEAPAVEAPLAVPAVGAMAAGGPVPAMGLSPRLELLAHVEMAVTVELGRTRMLLRDLLGLRPGSIVELDRSAGSTVDVMVNGTILARGEVVVVDDDLGVRITEVVGAVDDGTTV